MAKSQIVKAVSTSVVISALEKSSKPLIAKLEKLTIATNTEYELAAGYLKSLKAYSKEAEAKEKSITDPIKISIKNTQALFQPFYERVADIEATTKAAMLEFVIAQDEKKTKLEEKFNAGGIKKVSTYIGKAHELEVSTGKSQIRKVKRLVIENLAVVPREYMMPDETKIKVALLSGKSIPGCKIVEEKTIAV